MLAKAKFQEQLLSTVLCADRDRNFQFSEEEAKRLCIRMKNQDGVDFDENRVRQSLVQADNSVHGFLQILRDIGKDDDKEDYQREDDDNEDDNDQARTSLSRSFRLVSIDQRKFMNSVLSDYSDQLLSSVTSGSDSDSGSTLEQRESLRGSLLSYLERSEALLEKFDI